MRLHVLVAAAAACALTACGPTNTVDGKYQGLGFTAINSAVSANVSDSKGESAVIVLATAQHLCEDLTAGKGQRMDQELELQLYSVDAQKQSHAPTKTGTYNLDLNDPSGLYAGASVQTTDQSCAAMSNTEEKGFSGTVTLTSIDSGRYQGSFQILMDGGDMLTGNFDTDSCAGSAVMQKFSDPASLSCQ